MGGPGKARPYSVRWRSNMVDNKLEHDEAQRAANYEAVKSNAAGEVVGEARRVNGKADIHADDIAAGMQQKAAKAIVETDQEVERGRAMARVSQFVDYVFFLIYGLLTIRLLLELFAARESAGFFKFVKAATGLVYEPFRGLMPSPSTPEGFTLALPIIAALVVYMLLHAAINGLLRMFAHRKTAI